MNLAEPESLKPTQGDPCRQSASLSVRARAFLSLVEAAQEISCTRRFIEKRIEDGEISVFRPSRRLVRIKRSEFDRWVESFSGNRKGGRTSQGGGETVLSVGKAAS